MAEIDLQNLLEEFNLPEPTMETVKKDVKVINPQTLELEEVDISNPDLIVAKNISKANAILDHVMKEIADGNTSAKLIEAVGGIINAINSSTTQLYAKQFNIDSIKLKIQALELKERQLKLLEGRGNHPVTNQNIVFTDRETILNYLKGGDSIKLIELEKEEHE